MKCAKKFSVLSVLRGEYYHTNSIICSNKDMKCAKKFSVLSVLRGEYYHTNSTTSSTKDAKCAQKFYLASLAFLAVTITTQTP